MARDRSTRNHEACEKALENLQAAERTLDAALRRSYVRITDASGYFPQPRRHGDLTELTAMMTAIRNAAADYMDLLAIHAEDNCCPIEDREVS